MYSQYRTPKRRHSSLFQRMEQEIQKISRKLSQAKGSTRISSHEKIKSLRKDIKKQEKDKSTHEKQQTRKEIFGESNNHYHKRKNIHFDQQPQPSVIQTVRIKRKYENELQFEPFSVKRNINSKTLNRRLNFVSLRENQEEKILKLEEQNQELSLKIKRLEQVCKDQSYRLGYASAYFDDKCRKLESQKEQYLKENIYLNKLCDHYKSKSNKYKQHLKRYSKKKISQSSYQSFRG